jgi:hypothetical protein
LVSARFMPVVRLGSTAYLYGYVPPRPRSLPYSTAGHSLGTVIGIANAGGLARVASHRSGGSKSGWRRIFLFVYTISCALHASAQSTVGPVDVPALHLHCWPRTLGSAELSDSTYETGRFDVEVAGSTHAVPNGAHMTAFLCLCMGRPN